MFKLLFRLVFVFFVLAVAYHASGAISPARAANSNAVTVNDMRLSVANDATRIVFDLTGPVDYKVFTLSNPTRVVVDIKNARTTFAPSRVGGLSKAKIKSLRTGIRNSNDVRLVLDMAAQKLYGKPSSFLAKPNDEYGHRLVLDLAAQPVASQSNGAANERVASVPAPVAVTAPVLPARTPLATPPVTSSVTSPRVVSAVPAITQNGSTNSSRTPQSLNFTKRREVIVAIDAGHGGQDPGALGPNGTREKDIVLALAKKIAKKINAEPGMRAVLVRSGDYYVGLKKRMKIARQQNADLFLSIHADAFHQPQVRGSSVYVLSQRGASSQAARWLAQKQNAADLIGGVKLADKEGDLAEVLLDLSQTATMSASYDAANLMLKQIGTINKLHKRKVQDAGFVVLKSPDVPSMLIETAFLSNPNEEKNLRNQSYQDKLTTAITQGVKQYFYQQPPADSLIASWIRPSNGQRTHVISSGETLGGIAQRYGVSLNQLRSFNRLSNDNIRIGQKLSIPINQASR